MSGQPYAVGERVYIRELDVFGRIMTVESFGTYAVECEWPMPRYVWRGTVDRLQPAQR